MDLVFVVSIICAHASFEATATIACFLQITLAMAPGLWVKATGVYISLYNHDERADTWGSLEIMDACLNECPHVLRPPSVCRNRRMRRDDPKWGMVLFHSSIGLSCSRFACLMASEVKMISVTSFTLRCTASHRASNVLFCFDGLLCL